jgi:hypothetical protein
VQRTIAASLAVALVVAAAACSSGSGGDARTAVGSGTGEGADAPSVASDPPPTDHGRSEGSGPAQGDGDVQFHDVAADVGLDTRNGAFRWDVSNDAVAMMGTGACWIDYDDDGWMDLYVVNTYAQRERSRWDDAGGLPRNALFRNDHGEFVDVSAESGTDLAVRGTGCVAADLDLDGHTDLYVTTAEVGVLLWNEGDGTFDDGAAEAGVDPAGWYAGAAVGDVNGDGWPDLFLAGYANLGSPIPDATQGFPNTHTGVRDLLYLSQGDGDSRDGRPKFREVGRDAGLEVVDFEYGLGALFADLDRDDDLDLYVANDTRPNRLYKNVAWPGGAEADPAGIGFRFEEAAGRAGVADPNAGMGIAEGDFDGDGLSDLFVTNSRDQGHAVYQGQRSDQSTPSFADVRRDLGPDLSTSTGWGVSWADLDLDTDLDLVVVNGDIPVDDLADDADDVQALVNGTAHGEPGSFADRSRELGLADVGPLLARGSATADYDNDGDLDMAVTTVGGPLALLENDGARGHWLEVQLAMFSPGARVTAVLPDGTELERELHAGGSYLSSEDPRLHFGLGTATTVDRLVIQLPGGRETSLRDVVADQVLEPDRSLLLPPRWDG